MGWTTDEQLLLVDVLGDVAVYNIHGQRLPMEFSLGTACAQEKLLNCEVYPGGVVGLTFENNLWAISDLTDVRPQKLADLEITSNPQCMVVRVSQAHGVEVRVMPRQQMAMRKSEIGGLGMRRDDDCGGQLSCDPTGSGNWFCDHDDDLTEWRAHHCIHTGRHTICTQLRQERPSLTAPIERLCVRADLSPILEFEPPTDAPPQQIAWCSNDLIAMLFESSLILVESEGEWTSFSVDGPLYMAQEMDCLRVITESKHLLLRLVSDSMVSVLSEESDHPGRDLYLARQAYDGQDATADMMLRNIKEQLPEAIHTCIHLASKASYTPHSFSCFTRYAGELMDVPQQRDALKAAIYGFAFCTGFPNLKIYETCQKLRILKSIREPEVGIVMTMKQFREQTIATLISRSTPLSGKTTSNTRFCRLVNAHHHFLASKICESMGLNQDEVLRHWACARISADGSATDDEELKSVIVDKLHGCKGVKYATIAKHAQVSPSQSLLHSLLRTDRNKGE